MSPAELRQANLNHFKRLLERTSDPQERTNIEGLLADEKLKPDGAASLRDALMGGRLRQIISMPHVLPFPSRKQEEMTVRTFLCFIFDNNCSVPTLSFILANDLIRARILARREMLATKGAVSVEIFEDNKLQGIETA